MRQYAILGTQIEYQLLFTLSTILVLCDDEVWKSAGQKKFQSVLKLIEMLFCN